MAIASRKLSVRPVMAIWRNSLRKLLDFYADKRGSLVTFFPKLFVFFMLLNMCCYWLALITAYPQEIAVSGERWEYMIMQFPVGFLGALFDSVSFFITVWIARRALKTTSLPSYIAHLSIDVLIAILATFWVLMVFSVSGWLVGMLQQSSVSLAESSSKYEGRLESAVRDPLGRQNIKNIYFGAMMGFSAMIPTMIHLYLSAQSVFLYLRKVAMRRFPKP